MHSMTSVKITFQIAWWGPEQKLFIIIRRTQYFVKMSLAVLFFDTWPSLMAVESCDSAAVRLHGGRRNWHVSESGCWDATGMPRGWPTVLVYV